VADFMMTSGDIQKLSGLSQYRSMTPMGGPEVGTGEPVTPLGPGIEGGPK
jgi:hypothetical protein